MQKCAITTKKYMILIMECLKYCEKSYRQEEEAVFYGEMQYISMSITDFIMNSFILLFFNKEGSEAAMEQEKEFTQRLYNMIHTELVEILQTDMELDLDGFIQFRLKRYYVMTKDFINKTEHEAVNMAKYEGFIDLMRKYISEYKGTIYHMKILFIKNKIIFLDDCNSEMSRKAFTYSEIQNNKKEDYILGMIISRAPRKLSLFINDNELNKNFIKTLEKLYGDMLTISNVLGIYDDFQMV